MKNKVLAASTLALATMCLPAGVALAQNADQGTQAAQGSNADAATAPAAQGNGAAAAAGQLQEVVVTAERRATNLQTTPIAIQAVSGDQLRSQQVNILDDLSLVVPSFQDFSPDGFLGDFNIRGVGSANVFHSTQGVAMLQDGMLMSESIGQEEPYFDIADVEALLGPQPTLVGANAFGGSIETNSANPNFNGLNGYIEGQLGNYSDRMFQGAVNLPVSDTFAMRLAFYDKQEGSFYKDIGATTAGYFVNAYPSGSIELMNDSPGADGNPGIDPGNTDSEGARLSVLWKPTDNFQVIGKSEIYIDDTGGQALAPSPYTYQTLWAAGSGPIYSGCSTEPASTNYPGAKGSQLICPGAGTTQHSQFYYPGETPYVLDYYGQEMYFDDLQSRDLLYLNYTFPDGIVLRSESGYNHIDVNYQNNVSYGPWNGGAQKLGLTNDDYLTEDITVVSPTTGKLNWLAGAYWYYRDSPGSAWEDEVTSPYQPNQLPAAVAFEQLEGGGVMRQAAVFGQVNWQFTNTLQLQTGFRENWDANFASNYENVSPAPGTTLSEPNGTGIYQPIYPTGCTANAAAECVPTGYKVLAQQSDNFPGNHESDSAPTGKIDLSWTPVPGQNFYAFYARGFKSGGTNQGSSEYPTFKPEDLNDWELGWKGRLFDGHMLTQVGAFYYDYQNMQTESTDVEYENDTSLGTGVNFNIPSAVFYGFSVAEQARVGGLGVNVNFAYEHTRLGEFTTLNSNALPPGWGSPTAIPQCLPGHTYSGDCFNYTPYEVNVSGEQGPYAPSITGNMSVDYNFRVGQGVIDPRVTYSYTSEQWTTIFEEAPYLQLGVRDVWDASVDWIVGHWDTQAYITNFTNDTYLLSDGAQVFYGEPRQLGIQATYKF